MPDRTQLGYDVTEWEMQLEALKVADMLPSFQEIVALARNAPSLHLAFRESSVFQFDSESLTHHVATDIMVAHGLMLHLADEREDYKAMLDAHIAKAETSLIHFQGLLSGAGHIFESNAELGMNIRLDENLERWLAKFLMGRIQKPPKRKGTDPLPIVERDHLICLFLRSIESLGYLPTEGVGTFAEASGCHAISEAWAGNPNVPATKTLMNIWSDR